MANDIGGVWRTIGGRRVFIKDGQDLASAMKESGKFKSAKKETKKEDEQAKSEFYKKLSNNDKDKYNSYLEKGYSKSDIENTLMYQTQEEKMRKADIEFANTENDNLQTKANKVVQRLKEQNKLAQEKNDANFAKEWYEGTKKTENMAKENLERAKRNGASVEDLSNRTKQVHELELETQRAQEHANKMSKAVSDDDFASVSKELQEISSRTGKSDLFSEAGKRWNELYKQDKNNVSKDLGDGYKVGVGYGGRVTMNSSHPYDDTNYAWAEKKGDKWQVNNPTNRKSEMFNSRDEALKEMKNIDKYISTGEVIRSYEGIKTHSSPKISYEDFKKNLNTNYMNKGIRDAYEKYKNKHPNSKMTFTQFKDNNK